MSHAVLAADQRAPGSEGKASVNRTAPKRRRIPSPVISLVLAVVLLTVAEGIARAGWVSELIVPAPSDVARSLWDGLSSGLLLKHAGSTITVSALGFVLASILAIGTAGLLVSYRRLEEVLMPFIVAIQSMPKVAIAPLILLWFGFSSTSKLVIVVVICFFPILINSMQGLRIRNRTHFEVLTALGATRRHFFLKLRLPASVPYVFAGLRLGVMFSLIGAIVAEFVGSQQGLGYLLLLQKAQFNTAGVFAVLTVLLVIAVSVDRATLWLEKRIAPWANESSVASAH